MVFGGFELVGVFRCGLLCNFCKRSAACSTCAVSSAFRAADSCGDGGGGVLIVEDWMSVGWASNTGVEFTVTGGGSLASAVGSVTTESRFVSRDVNELSGKGEGFDIFS